MAISKDFNALGEAVEQFQEGVEEINVIVGRKIRLYPFVKASGFTRYSEFGESALQDNPEARKTDLLIQNGSEPITLYWNNAVNFVVQPDGITTKKVLNPNIDDLYYECVVISISYSNNDKESVSLNGSDYQTFTHSRTLVLYSRDWLPSIEAMDDFLYVVLDSQNYVGGQQILKITTINPIYNQANGQAEGCEITLQEVNLDYSHNAKDLLALPQFAPIGGNYAFPKEVVNNGVVETFYDASVWNNDVGCQTLQLGIYGGALISGLNVYGRPKDNDYVLPIRKLFVMEFLAPISSTFDVHGIDTMDYYYLMGAIPRNTGVWKNWRSWGQSKITNTTGNMVFYGGLDINTSTNTKTWEKVVGTNGGYGDNQPTGDWDSVDMNANTPIYSEWNITPYDISTNSDGISFDVRASKWLWASDIDFKLSNIMPVYSIFNFCSMVYETMELLPINYSTLIRFSLGDVPLLGGLLKFVMGGINPTWLTGSVSIPKNKICGLIPTESFKMGTMNIGTDGEAGISNQYLKYDVFSGDTSDITSVGNKQMISTIRVRFTDRVRMSHLNLSDDTLNKLKGIDGIDIDEDNPQTQTWNTMYLGQQYVLKKVSENLYEKIYFIDKTGKIITIKINFDSVFVEPINQKWEIDGISYNVISCNEARLTAFDDVDISKARSIWENRHITNSKWKGSDMTLWTNKFKTNFIDRYNTIGTLIYPQEIIPPSAHGLYYEPFYTESNLTTPIHNFKINQQNYAYMTAYNGKPALLDLWLRGDKILENTFCNVSSPQQTWNKGIGNGSFRTNGDSHIFYMKPFKMVNGKDLTSWDDLFADDGDDFDIHFRVSSPITYSKATNRWRQDNVIFAEDNEDNASYIITKDYVVKKSSFKKQGDTWYFESIDDDFMNNDFDVYSQFTKFDDASKYLNLYYTYINPQGVRLAATNFAQRSLNNSPNDGWNMSYRHSQTNRILLTQNDKGLFLYLSYVFSQIISPLVDLQWYCQLIMVHHPSSSTQREIVAIPVRKLITIQITLGDNLSMKLSMSQKNYYAYHGMNKGVLWSVNFDYEEAFNAAKDGNKNGSYKEGRFYYENEIYTENDGNAPSGITQSDIYLIDNSLKNTYNKKPK